MKANKTFRLNIEDVKKWEKAAKLQHRTLTNWIEATLNKIAEEELNNNTKTKSN